MKPFFFTAILLCLSAIGYSQANTKLSNLVAPTTVNASLVPNTTATKDLGTSTLAWKDQYLRGYVYLDGTRFVSNAPGTTSFNAFVGSNAGVVITSGNYNSALGHCALNKNTLGYANTATGAFAMYNNTSGYSNTAVGVRALYSNTIGYFNTAVGDSALYASPNSYYNTAIGYMTLSRTTGGSNTALGYASLRDNTSGFNNTALGYGTLMRNASGNVNVAIGNDALINNTTGGNNIAIGMFSLLYNNGSFNTAIGVHTLYNTHSSQYNTAVGFYAGKNYNNGYNNVFVGANTDVNGLGYYNVIAIGQATICTAPSQVTIGNPATNSYRAYAYWSNISDGRYKKNLKEDVPGLAFINKLRPVTYTLDASGLDAFLNNGRGNDEKISAEAQAVMQKALKEKDIIVETGFIAQEVEQAAKEWKYNFSGVEAPKNDKDVYALRYSEFVVPLVKAVQELSKENKVLKQKNEDLERRLQKLEILLGNANTITTTSAFLEQNTPNPVSATTLIRYSIPGASTSARLDITNAKGQLLKTISLGNRGTGQINFNSQALASGTYNYTLYVDGKQADTKRLVISR
jgi:trimeric autotransporter adhesin